MARRRIRRRHHRPRRPATRPRHLPTPDGDCLGRFTQPAYAFDGDQVLYYQRGCPRWLPNRVTWYALTVTTTDEGTVVALVPATRLHGESYLDTEALDLPQLAVWLMADLTRLARDTTSVIPPQSRFAVAVNNARAEIRLYHYGLTRADDGRAVWEAVSAATAAHNWTNPHDIRDRRFTLLPDTPRDDQIPELRERGRGPGTVTVLCRTPHLLDLNWAAETSTSHIRPKGESPCLPGKPGSH
jgi:hypothetical protein